MTPPRETDWTPTPELLAAYIDGEFEGRDDLVRMRGQLEDWLCRHPGIQGDLCQYRSLRQVWLATTPVEPSGRAWNAMQANLERVCATARRDQGPRRRRPWVTRTAPLAACIALFVGWSSMRDAPHKKPGPGIAVPQEVEPFPVATESEIAILRVEGQDEHMVVVGQFPLHGALEIANHGDVTLTSVETQPNSIPPRLHGRGPGSPMMIWVRVDTDQEEP